jgi:hypothetical protein
MENIIIADADYSTWPQVGREEAIRLLRRNRPDIVWNCISTFETNAATLPDTEKILSGISIESLSIEELLQIKDFGHAHQRLEDMLFQRKFEPSLAVLTDLHALAAKNETRVFGALRDCEVRLRGINNYTPPLPKSLYSIAGNGLRELAQISNPVARSIVAFGFLSRNQFFEDCNKRTALLCMNGILVDEGFAPVVPLRMHKREFMDALRQFYESGTIKFLSEYYITACKQLWSPNCVSMQYESDLQKIDGTSSALPRQMNSPTHRNTSRLTPK